MLLIIIVIIFVDVGIVDLSVQRQVFLTAADLKARCTLASYLTVTYDTDVIRTPNLRSCTSRLSDICNYASIRYISARSPH